MDANEGQPPDSALLSAAELARILGVPATVMSFLESQFPEIRAIRSGNARTYRAADASLIAGIVELLYDEGRAFRDVDAAVRSGERSALVERGAARLGLSDLTQKGPAPEAIPPDAIVRRRGSLPPAPAPLSASASSGEVLSELMACVSILASARRDDG